MIKYLVRFNTDEVVFFTLDDTIQNHTYPVEGLFYVNRDGEYTIYANHGANKTVRPLILRRQSVMLILS